MFEQYKRTFVRMQVAIWAVAAMVVVLTRHLADGALFFATMQFGAVFGSYWGTRLRRASQAPYVGTRNR